MSESRGKESTGYGILVKTGRWKEIVVVSEKIELILSNLKTEEIKENISEEEFEVLDNDLKTLCKRWKEWRPHRRESYSEEMREKTAEQSSIDEGPLEREGKDAEEEIEKAGNSVKKAAEETKNGKLKDAGEEISSAIKRTGKAVDREIRPEVRKIEETAYKAVLRLNSLYFDTDLVGAILSKRRGSAEDKFELDVHVTNPRLRKKIEEEVSWNDRS